MSEFQKPFFALKKGYLKKLKQIRQKEQFETLAVA
jgi:hypothetical protein